RGGGDHRPRWHRDLRRPRLTCAFRGMLRPMRRGSLVLALVLACSLGLVACGPGTMPPSLNHPLAGAQAPALRELAAEPTEVGIWHGAPVKVTVVDFWASWCQGCQESLPELDALYRDKRAAGLAVIGVSVDE